jgi:hypothetical protein
MNQTSVPSKDPLFGGNKCQMRDSMAFKEHQHPRMVAGVCNWTLSP